MKLVIDIDDGIYKAICDCDSPQIISHVAIKNGTPYEERPHGEWIECEEMNCHSDIEKIYICPFCKMKHHRKYDFCNCGADMKEGEAE